MLKDSIKETTNISELNLGLNQILLKLKILQFKTPHLIGGMILEKSKINYYSIFKRLELNVDYIIVEQSDMIEILSKIKTVKEILSFNSTNDDYNECYYIIDDTIKMCLTYYSLENKTYVEKKLGVELKDDYNDFLTNYIIVLRDVRIYEGLL